MRVVALIQARLGSTRLPGKSLMDLGGLPLVAHAVLRARAIPGVHQVALIVPQTDLEAFQEGLGSLKVLAPPVRLIGGTLEPLARYVKAARLTEADAVVRLTGDNPLLCPLVAGATLKAFQTAKVDYASNCLHRTFPDGCDTEVIAVTALRRTHEEAQDPYDREHVTPYLYKHPELFKLFGIIYGEASLGHLRWTVDTMDDLDHVRAIVARLGSPLDLTMAATVAAERSLT